MRTETPKFLLGSSQSWETFDASGGCVILPGFSSADTAANYCDAAARRVSQGVSRFPEVVTFAALRETAPGPCGPPGAGRPSAELQPLDSAGLRERIGARYSDVLTLIAADPASPGELSLLAATLDAVCGAIDAGRPTVEPQYRLMRDHRAGAWKHQAIAGSTCPAKTPKWYVACLHPENMTLAAGQPLWFWLDWFDGRHVATELQTERGGRMERDVFLFASHDAAEAFHSATIDRLRGCVCHCHVASHRGDEFEVAIWEEGNRPCRSTSALIGDQSECARR